MDLDTQLQRRRRQQVCCSALVSSCWSLLAPEGCETITRITPFGLRTASVAHNLLVSFTLHVQEHLNPIRFYGNQNRFS
jgi:hypothetical protein